MVGWVDCATGCEAGTCVPRHPLAADHQEGSCQQCTAASAAVCGHRPGGAEAGQHNCPRPAAAAGLGCATPSLQVRSHLLTVTELLSSSIAQQHSAAATDTPCTASAGGLPIPTWLHAVSSGLLLLVGL